MGLQEALCFLTGGYLLGQTVHVRRQSDMMLTGECHTFL